MTFDPYHKWLGIPPAEQPANHYRLLAVAMFEDDPDVIETAADQRMALLRTFQTAQHSADSQRLLNELSAARLCLLTPDKKSAYDAELRRRLEAARPIAQAIPAARPIAAAPLGWVPVDAAREQAPLFATSNAIPHVTRKRRRGLHPFVSACLALAVVAAPILIGYLIYKKSAQHNPPPQRRTQLQGTIP